MHRRTPCPDCGAPKADTAKRCRSCANQARRTAEHGTDSAYYRHRRDGEQPCAACQAAHNRECVERERHTREVRRRARDQQRAAKRRCPECGGVKSPQAERCLVCWRTTPRNRGWAEHGTDGGYTRHVRQTGWPKWSPVACDECRKAHAADAAERQARSTKPPRARPARYRSCPDCGTRIGAQSRRCRSCAQKNRARLDNNPTIRWQRVGPIWKAA